MLQAIWDQIRALLGLELEIGNVDAIQDGEIQREGMRKAGLSHHDLVQALRLQAQFSDTSKVKLAYMERNGDISVLQYHPDPRILDVEVQDGVQTVRIEVQ